MHIVRFIKGIGTHRLVCAFGALTAATLLSHGAANAAAELRQCQAATGSQARLTVAYAAATKGQDVVRQFDADLELQASGQYKEGQIVRFLVAGVDVGWTRLARDANGDLEADLKLTTEKKRGPNAWSDDFPRVQSGTQIAAQMRGITILHCSFF